MGGRGRMDHQGAGVTDVRQVADHLEALDEAGPRRPTPDQTEGEDGPGSLGQVPESQIVMGRGLQAGVLDPRHLGMGLEVAGDGQGVLDVAVHSQGQVSTPCNRRNELNGEMQAPMSRSCSTRSLVQKAYSPKFSQKRRPP